jgi:Protein of unknown function (DUF732)
MRRRLGMATGAAVAAALWGTAAVIAPMSAHADAVAYLVNVTVRPGYDFTSPDAAISYGRGLCDKVAAEVRYANLVNDVKVDFATADDYQASHLIAQAVGELCQAQIWQLRRSATAYRPPA